MKDASKSFISPTKKRKLFDGTQYNIVPESPTLDKTTPIGRHVPQSQGPYCAVAKADIKPVYHAQAIKIVPLKKKQGRPLLKATQILFHDPVEEFRFHTCGYILGNDSTKGKFSQHEKHSVLCQCKEFVNIIKQKDMTWHWYKWWKSAKTSERYQFLFHHTGFNIIRARRKARKRRPPAHVLNMTIPGIV